MGQKKKRERELKIWWQVFGCLEKWVRKLGMTSPYYCKRNWYSLILIVTCITRDTILTMIPIAGKYGEPHRRPQASHEIDYIVHTRWILKDIRRRTHNLTWFNPNLTYVYGERTWESFINNLIQRDLAILLRQQGYSPSYLI